MSRTCITLLTLLLLLAGNAYSAPDDKPPATFFRGLNLNGPALVIDGNAWDGKDAKSYECKDHELDIPTVPLRPPTDRNRTRMIRTSRWGTNVKVTLTDIPSGAYQVCLYVWEDNNAVDYSVTLNGKVVQPRYYSRSAGQWEKLGPWLVRVSDGKIALSSSGGDANFSGIEVWKGDEPLPAPTSSESVTLKEPTPDQLEFFEKKIRPLLANRCYSCHSAGAKKVRGELLLDTRAGLQRGGASGPCLVPGSPDESLLITAVRGTDEALKMPPDEPLSKSEIADLERWVRLGAPDPRGGSAPMASSIDFAKGKQWWAFQPLRAMGIPAGTAGHPIDRFLDERLERADLKRGPQADRRTLIRRATFDLTGLPPTPAEVEAFLADDAPDAWERLVDRLLAAPAYGERWGRHWLDLVRYADTSGCNSDFPVPTAYLYRNWVIAALNADVPYDHFVRTQVAGDLLPFDSEAERQRNIIATGYLAIGRRFGSLADEFHLTIEDNIDNLGKAVLGLSVSCARCHDHKFDPISIQDYYGLYGIFESTRYAFPGTEIPPEPRDFVPLIAPDVYQQTVLPLEREQAKLQKEIEKFSKEVESLKKKVQADGKEEDRQTLQETTETLTRLRQQKAGVDQTLPKYLKAYAVTEGKPANARVQRKGDPRQAGDTVPRGFLQVLGGQRLPDSESGSGRLQLADWLTDKNNPLTARVLVNRVWQQHFGQGLVRTPNDFGARGAAPTHPELLDWLAAEFRSEGQSLKRLHRLIMTSDAYRMAVVENADASIKDPKNELGWTFNRRRLSAEEYRDALLLTSGALDRTPGAAHPFPQAPLKFTQHKPFYGVYDMDRRSVYLMQQRLKKHPWLDVFDGADPNAITATRPLNTTPIQALAVMNDPLVHQLADRFAQRLLKDAADDDQRLELAYRLTLSRTPNSLERSLSTEHLQQTRAALREMNLSPDQAEAAAWASWARALWSSNEFLFLD